MKYHDIDKFLTEFSTLRLKINKGERHRIMHENLKSKDGSLWFQPYSDKFRLYPTGLVVSYLGPVLREKFGSAHGQDMGRDYWYVNQLNEVKEIVKAFAELKI